MAYHNEQQAKQYNVPLHSTIQSYLIDTCLYWEVDTELILAMMGGESTYNSLAVGHNNNGTTDSGLMQINSCNKDWLTEVLGITDFMDPKQNIECGVSWLRI